MSIIDRQMQLGRDLFELNTSTARRLFEVQTSGMRQYFETNEEFAKRLPEIRDVSSFVELQREYGQTLWSDMQSNLRENGSVLREAVEHTGKAIRTAFTSAGEEGEEEVSAAA
ncbi:MAG: phasin family protein [Pseudomonadota bacterium]